jgi:hypothetical protein
MIVRVAASGVHEQQNSSKCWLTLMNFVSQVSFAHDNMSHLVLEELRYGEMQMESSILSICLA